MTNSTITVRVARKVAEAQDICSLELVDLSGAPLPAFSAGAHIDVHLPDGLTRQYSLCNAPDERHRYMLGVLRDPASRGGSNMMHDGVREGDTLCISAPKNHFTLDERAKHSILLAGGIGITPILCMAERLHAIGASFDMHYYTRARARTAFCARIEESGFADRVRFHFDAGEVAQKLDLNVLFDTLQPGIHLYVCGPKGYMDMVLGGARERGWPEEQLHFEFFANAVAPSVDDQSFQVKLARSGRLIAVAADQTVVAALAEAGIEISTSCEQGVCGTCLTRVLEGEPDHKDMYLSPDEQASNDQFLPCCSRSKSRVLVLDL